MSKTRRPNLRKHLALAWAPPERRPDYDPVAELEEFRAAGLEPTPAMVWGAWAERERMLRIRAEQENAELRRELEEARRRHPCKSA